MKHFNDFEIFDKDLFDCMTVVYVDNLFRTPTVSIALNEKEVLQFNFAKLKASNIYLVERAHKESL